MPPKIKEVAQILFPSILLYITAVLFTYASAIVSISPGLIVRSIVFGIAITLILFFLLRQFIKSKETISLMIITLTGGLFLVKSLFYGTIFTSSLAFITLIGTRKILKIKAAPMHTTYVLMFISTFLFLATAIQFITPLNQVDWDRYTNSKHKAQASIPVSGISVSQKPDIYYIILDAYARNDILVEYYNYDNSDFIKRLKEKGFVVPENATSNYPYTTLSITSSLNLDYVDAISSGIEDSHLWWLMEPYVDKSRTHLFLKAQGYEPFYLASDWSITDNTEAENYLSPYKYKINEFESYFISVTPFRVFFPVLGKISKTTGYDAHRNLILQNFKVLGEIPESQSPKFVFAHIIAPHPPFVFNKDGDPIRPGYNFSFTDGNAYPGTAAEYRTSYIEQLQYTNVLIERTVNAILQNSKTPPIIILQADHGPRMLSGSGTTENVCIRERFSIFSAYYFPGKNASIIPENISPVNTFRIVFNQYFRTDLSLLENKILMPTDKISIFKPELVSPNYDDVCYQN